MPHPAQGCSPQGSGTDAAATRAAQNAISENERIFPIFAQRLASNEPKEFINTARKLAIWLSSEKAYYLAARPKIVELLEIALSAFMNTFTHHSLVTEIADHLRQLVHAVSPFKHLFRENELQSRLQRVILDTTLSLPRTPTSTTRATAPSEESVATSLPSSTHASSVNPQLSPTDHHSSTWRPRPSLSMSSVEKPVPVGSAHAELHLARNHPEGSPSSQIGATPSFLSPVIYAPQRSGDNVSPTAAFKPLPKRTGKIELSEELMARDLDWFRSNQNVMLNKDPSSTVGESSPLPPSDVSHVPRRSPSPKKKTARIFPSRRLPRRIPLDARGVDSGVSTSTFPPASMPLAMIPRSSENVEGASPRMDQMDAEEENPSIEMMEPMACSTTTPEVSTPPQVSRSGELPSPELQPVATPSNEPSIERQTPQTDHQAPTIEDSLANGHVPGTTLNGIGSVDVAASESDSESLRFQSQSRAESTAPQSPQMPKLQNLNLPPLVDDLNPPLNLDFRILQIPSSQPLQTGLDTNHWRFDDGMTILRSTQGKAFTCAYGFYINLSESSFSKISKWVKRRSHPSEAFQGVCISLGCYRIAELFDTNEFENKKLDIETLISRSSCSWPSSNQLSLHIKGERSHTTITLSPPLFLTPDQCVDMSPLMKPGDNGLEIVQKNDLSEYLIVLHAHPPTRTQLAEFDVVRSADERWRRLLDVLSGEGAQDGSPAGTVEDYS